MIQTTKDIALCVSVGGNAKLSEDIQQSKRELCKVEAS
jgi:hypothetical protein